MSEKPVELIPLLCTSCQTPIPANHTESAWACEQCGQGLMLSEEVVILPIKIHYQSGIPQNEKGKPFWVVMGKAILTRKTHKGNESDQMEAFWAGSRRFFIPASQITPEEAVRIGTQYIIKPPVLQEGSATTFYPVTTRMTDIRPMVEFIILTIEAKRKDFLKELHIQLNLEEPELWILA